MNQKLLSLIPKRFLCPYCGEWHEWDEDHELECYDSKLYKAQLKCPNSDYNDGDYRIYFYDGYCYYSTDSMCKRATQTINGRIPISSIIESADEPIVTFEVPFTAQSDVGMDICSDCPYIYYCICAKLGDEGDHRHMTITFGFEFEQSDYNKFAQVVAPARKKQVSQQPQVKENKEETTMANNIFNMSMEFGQNKDENIASTLMGIAVKNGDSWRIYDKAKKEITDLGNMELSTLPIFLVPSTKLSEGDLIKDSGEYYYATKVATSLVPTQLLSVKTGEMKNVVPIKNILGINCYSKVIALSDSFDLDVGGDDKTKNLLLMSCMTSSENGSDKNGSQMNQLLPLLLFKDKLSGDDGDDKTKDLLLMSCMMSSENGSGENGSQMNQLLPLLLFKDKLGGDDGDDKTKDLLFMSCMMGGNMGIASNPMMTYLMLDALMGKKDNEALQSDYTPNK